MSNGNQFERLWKLQAMIGKLVLDGKRDPKKVANILQAIINGSVTASFDHEVVKVVQKRLESLMSLEPRGVTTITLVEEEHDPNAFYHQTCSGRCIWDDFLILVVSNAKVSRVGTTHKVACVELMRDMTSKEIEAELPVNHIFNETNLCATIAGLIMRQPNGEKGTLLNDLSANLFYLHSWVVDVAWSDEEHEWYVQVFERNEEMGASGSFVFYPC